MFKKTKLVLADIGTSKTDICVEPYFQQVHSFPTLIAYDDQGTHIGQKALSRAGAADLVWVKDAARISKQELKRHPQAFTDFVRITLEGLQVKDPVDLMMSEPILMTKFARDQILSQLSEISQIQRVYFLEESIASIFSADLKGRLILIDMGDGNSSVQAFNNRAPITKAAQQTFRAGRAMTYQCAETLREFFDIDYDVTSASSANYRYIINLKHQLLSQSEKVQVIDNDNMVQTIPVTSLIQNSIVKCLFDDRQYKPVHEIVKNVAFTVKDLSADLLQNIYITGRPFTSAAVEYTFSSQLNNLLKEEKAAFDIQKISVTKLKNYSHSVIEGMKRLGKSIQEKSEKWIDLNGQG